MALSEKERNILVYTQLSADVPLSKVAKKTGYRPQTVSRCIRKLLAQKVIYKTPLLNLTALGFDEYLIYFSLASDKTKLRSSLLQVLMESQHVKWMLELAGDFQFVMGVMFRSPSELSAFLDGIANSFGNVFFQKSVAVVVLFAHYGRRYLATQKIHGDYVMVSDVPNTTSFDENDHRILCELAHGDADTLRPLSKKTGLPVSTIRYRIKKMEACGLIARFVYSCPQIIQDTLSYRILMYAKGLNAELHKNLFSFCEKQRNVVSCVKTLGSCDYELRVEVEGNEELATLLRSLYDHFGSEINTLKTEPVLRVLKPASYPVRDFPIVDIKRTPRP